MQVKRLRLSIKETIRDTVEHTNEGQATFISISININIRRKTMKLLTKVIKEQAEKQYAKGDNMQQKVVAKFFDPMSRWTWYLMNKDPESDYCWGIVDGNALEIGSFGLNELQEYTGHFGLGIERDTMFEPVKAIEIWDKLNATK